jgi:hypothetical protein
MAIPLSGYFANHLISGWNLAGLERNKAQHLLAHLPMW